LLLSRGALSGKGPEAKRGEIRKIHLRRGLECSLKSILMRKKRDMVVVGGDKKIRARRNQSIQTEQLRSKMDSLPRTPQKKTILGTKAYFPGKNRPERRRLLRARAHSQFNPGAQVKRKPQTKLFPKIKKRDRTLGYSPA